MADETITVATYEQIATLLSKLAVNYSNMASKFFDIFYSTTAQDISLQIYDASGVLQTYTIPNRAKDFTYITNGSGSPEGTKTANVGTIYQDTTNGKLYIKETGTGVTGWVQIYAGQEILHGSGSPEGVLIAETGVMYVDDVNGALYIKTDSSSSSQAEGWSLISANTSNLVNKDLSNLTTTGEAHFANPSLGNLNATGQAILTAKEDKSNKTASIESTSTDTEYPSAKATYTYAESVRSDRADKSLSNLDTTGNYKVLPSHTGNSGKALFSNGVYGVWTDPTTTLAKTDLSNTSSFSSAFKTLLLNTLFPVGAVYGSITNTATCPIQSSLGGTWTLVSSGKALWTGTGSNAGTTIAAGLPNITGIVMEREQVANENSGAFYTDGSISGRYKLESGTGYYTQFSASRSSSIYGNSTTVQPPAYVVNVWRRTS